VTLIASSKRDSAKNCIWDCIVRRRPWEERAVDVLLRYQANNGYDGCLMQLCEEQGVSIGECERVAAAETNTHKLWPGGGRGGL